ncbi:DUF2691 domain-containing protein [Carnobacterium maltaromaticum]|uniref:DUF2691 domain-containing protein n=1 Tax=Carnobacterium maltaromaticum TaxID=2751 RepID=UPI00191BB057|nr:DUF2691 domain-containing protein [Carnobacterium maltaromaticum]CAD5903180.1 conserved hypothetical protein [Carnobacterium maltaromaticum]
MEGLLIKDEKKEFARLQNIFTALNGEQLKYNWLITEIDYAQVNNEVSLLSQPYTWISGEELTERAKLDNGFWVWGVFSGFSKEIDKEEILKFELPYADGYTGFWENPLTVQHPLASIEFVEWDGTLFLAITNDQKILMDLKTVFPTARNLIDYNNEP